MSTDHNRIKIADLEKGTQNQILVANTNGELEFRDINNALDCTVPGKVLDARQGKILKDLIDNINLLLSSDNINLNTVQELVDAIETVQISLNTILVNDLTTGGITKALTAEMGKSLQNSKVDKVAGERLINTAEITKLGNLSGLNSGDNSVNSLYSGLITNATHTGDATGATTLTLATVNSNIGSFGTASNVAQYTVNGKGLTTASANVPIQISESQVTNLVSDLAAKQGTLTLTTTGSSGPATLVSNTLNIPSYTGGGGVDETALHQTGNESFTGIKTTTSTGSLGTGLTTGISLISNGAANTYPLSVRNTGNSSTGMYFNDTSTGGGGSGIKMYSTGGTLLTGYISGSVMGTDISTTGYGNIYNGSSNSSGSIYFGNNTGSGTVFSSNVAGSANGFISNMDPTATGVAFKNVLNGATNFNVDKSGNTTALTFVKTGGTAAQFLKANGSVDSNAYAVLAGPTFTGVPKAPTAAVGTNTTQLASTAFVLANALTTAGNQSFTGKKSTVIYNGAVDGGIYIQSDTNYASSWREVPALSVLTTNGGQGIVTKNTGTSSSALSVENTGDYSKGIIVTNSGLNSSGISVSSTSGNGITIYNSGASGIPYVGLQVISTAGTPIQVSNNGTLPGVLLHNSSPSPALDIRNYFVGGLAISTGSDGNFTVNSAGNITGNSLKLNSLQTAPTSSTDTGITGEIRYTADYIYLCTATNTWVRSPLSTF